MSEDIRGDFGLYDFASTFRDVFATLPHVSTVWVDVGTPISEGAQNGQIWAPFNNIQDAIDHSISHNINPILIVVGMGVYAENLTIPQDRDITILGNWRGPETCQLNGNVDWTVSGDFTSKLGIRHFAIEGTVTVLDGSPAATNAVFTTEWSQIGATAGGNALVSAGSSALTVSLVGASFAAFGTATSIVAQSVVSGDIELSPGSSLFVAGTQFRDTCTIIKTGNLLVWGCGLEQNIEITSPSTPHAEFKTTHFEGPCTLTFISAPGVAEFDGPSNGNFIVAGCQVVNGKKAGVAAFSGGIAAEPILAQIPRYNSNSQFLTLVLGSQTDGGAFAPAVGNGALYAGARAGVPGSPPTKEPFTGVSIWDFGAGVGLDQGRVLYQGGGGWNCPDCTGHQFYTAPLYNEVNDSGLLRMHIAATGAVRIGNTEAGATGLFQVQGALGGAAARIDGGALVVNNRIRKTGQISPTALGANTNNYNPAGLANTGILRISATTPVNLTGIAAGVEGDELDVINVGSNTITLTHEDASSTAANRFLLAASASIALTQHAVVRLRYSSDARWRCMAKSL